METLRKLFERLVEEEEKDLTEKCDEWGCNGESDHHDTAVHRVLRDNAEFGGVVPPIEKE